MRFSNRIIILGVTGSIAAYKSLDICRRLRKEGADVHVLLSDGAKNFITPLSFQTVSGNKVLENQFDYSANTKVSPSNSKTGAIKHIDLSKADALLIAPATANIVAKAAAGLADDLLSTTLQAFSGPVLFAPAMNDVMYAKQVQLRNIQRLKQLGYAVIAPDFGDLACGRKGQGRLASTEKIMARLETLLQPQDLAGKTILITAGPTREYIDTVRFITNASSGKMGYALAEAAASRGAKVVLISGPTALQPPAGVKTVTVESTQQMLAAVKKHFPNADVFISAAAPADFAPFKTHRTKIAKAKISALKLKATPDILTWAGKAKKKNQKVIGFALEQPSTLPKARRKLFAKSADAMVLNGVKNLASEKAAGTLVLPRSQKTLPKKTKLEFAHSLLDELKQNKPTGEYSRTQKQTNRR